MYLFKIFLFTLSFCYSQNSVILSGRISDIKGDPIPFANIYIDKSSVGATADLDGNYIIKNIPLGLQRVVVTQINYEKYIFELKLDRSQTITKNIILKDIVNESSEIIVEVERDAEFVKLYNQFKKDFLGYSDFSDDCEIINPEYLELKSTVIVAMKEKVFNQLK